MTRAGRVGRGDVPVAPGRAPRRFPEWPLALVLAGVALGLGVVATGHFRRGTVVLAVATLLATALRAGLPERTAGLLVVRSRTLDVLVLAVLGLGLGLLGLVVPPPARP